MHRSGSKVSKDRSCLEELIVYGRIIVKQIVKKLFISVLTGLILLR